jgi:hypothetical protein
MRHTLIAVAVALSWSASAQAQDLSAFDGASQLGPIIQSLTKDLGDLLDVANTRSSNCDQMRTAMDLAGIVVEATSSIQMAQIELRIYSVVSTPADRVRVRAILEPTLKVFRNDLELDIKQTYTHLGSVDTHSAASLGPRMRDHMQSAIGIIEKVTIH